MDIYHETVTHTLSFEMLYKKKKKTTTTTTKNPKKTKTKKPIDLAKIKRRNV